MIKKGRRILMSSKDDERTKIAYERINSSEKHLGEICSALSSYTRKLGRFRDKNDEVARILKNFSEDELITKSLSMGADKLSKAITYLADFMHIEVQRLEFKVVNELLQYEHLCRQTREILKATIAQRDKDIARKKHLMEFKGKLVANINAPDSEIVKVSSEINRLNKDIDELVQNFERQKLRDLKAILLDFISIRLKQHTKSIEVLSAAYQDVSEIDEETDVQSLKSALKTGSPSPKRDLPNVRSQSLETLEIAHSSASLFASKGNQPLSARLSKSTKDLPVKIDEEDVEHRSSLTKVKKQKKSNAADDEEEEDDDDEDDEEDDDEEDEADEDKEKANCSTASEDDEDSISSDFTKTEADSSHRVGKSETGIKKVAAAKSQRNVRSFIRQ